MKLAVYSLTRERRFYTEHNFELLCSKAGHNFDHYVIDNGSLDGTKEYLENNSFMFKHLEFLSENIGISKASNLALDLIKNSGIEYEYIMKFDNDCEIISDKIIREILRISDECQRLKYPMLLSPRIGGLKYPPGRFKYVPCLNYTLGLTSIIGGIFHILPAAIYQQYRFPEHLPKAKGQDDIFCQWLHSKKIGMGYAEELLANHFETTDGQSQRYPEYFQRKYIEEKIM